MSVDRQKSGKGVTPIDITGATAALKTAVSHVLGNNAKITRDAGASPIFSASDSSTKSKQLKIILLVDFDLRDINLVARLRGVKSYLTPLNYSTLLCTIEENADFQTYQRIINSGQIDGILFTGDPSPRICHKLPELKEMADQAGLPIVALVDTFPPEIVHACTLFDNKDGANQAVNHLIEHGHRRILLLGASNRPWAFSREQGYRAALENAGIPIDPALITHCNWGASSQKWAYDTTLRLIKTHDFTAIFAITDTLAIAAIRAVRRFGKSIPMDCAVVGFDDVDMLAKFTDPTLTTVKNPFVKCGVAGAKMLIDLINNRPINPIVQPTSLIIRQSCGCKG